MEVRRRKTVKEPSAGAFEKAKSLVTNIDAFPKIDSDFQKKSKSGGGLAVVTLLFTVFMVSLEIHYFLKSHMEYEYEVNFETSPKIDINIDITVAMPCSSIDADVYDHIGQSSFAGEAFPAIPTVFSLDENQANIFNMLSNSRKRMLSGEYSIEEMLLRRLERNSLSSKPMKGVADMKQDMAPIEVLDACRFNGSLSVNRHSGTLHIILGKQINLGFGGSFHAHVQQPGLRSLNFSHRIDHLSFGPIKIPFVGALDGELKVTKSGMQEYQYRMTVVPVRIQTFGSDAKTYRFSVTEKEKVIDHSQGAHGQPGIFFKYDFASLKIIAKEKREPVLQFFVRLVGIIGGAFSLSNFFFFAFDFITCKGRSDGD